MSVPLRSSAFEPYSAYDADDIYKDELELSAGERIGGPVSRTNDVLAWLTVIAIAVGSSWSLVHEEGALFERARALTARASEAVNQIISATSTPVREDNSYALSTAGQAEAPPPPPLPDETAVPDAPAVMSELAVANAAADASDSGGASAEHGDAQSRDPYQARAEAVGLNPSLSRIVLARFSAADLRNARYAIETAIAKTPDDGVFVWPRQRKPSEALFKVYFVAGAAPDCRRYVVGVTMSNWTTTALPMEKCGVSRVAATKRATR